MATTHFLPEDYGNRGVLDIVQLSNAILQHDVVPVGESLPHKDDLVRLSNESHVDLMHTFEVPNKRSLPNTYTILQNSESNSGRILVAHTRNPKMKVKVNPRAKGLFVLKRAKVPARQQSAKKSGSLLGRLFRRRLSAP